jgi:1-aminocyclopropane-1-carboxylate deaminase
MQLPLNAPVQEVQDPFLAERGINLLIKREDLIHEHISGNKWRKLKYNLQEAERQGEKNLLSFGGAYSNHIAALAFAGKELGFSTTGIIRGEPVLPLNPTLSFAVSCGMKLHFVDRGTYREKDSALFIRLLRMQFGDFYLIPEGGANEEGIKGCEEILQDLPFRPDVVCCACGTGTTLAGIIRSLSPGETRVIGFSALKGAFSLDKSVAENTRGSRVPWEIIHEYHFGGYAKVSPELMEFIGAFENRTSVPLEPVYTGKMLYGIYDRISKGFFSRGEKILAIHTGGLQGNRGFGR